MPRGKASGVSYACYDCLLTFQIFTTIGTSTKVSCPLCADDVSVHKYSSGNTSKHKKQRSIVSTRWTDEEVAVVSRIITGELETHQAALLLGRSINSVRGKRDYMLTKLKEGVK